VKSATKNDGITVYMPEEVIYINAVRMGIIQKFPFPSRDV